LDEGQVMAREGDVVAVARGTGRVRVAVAVAEGVVVLRGGG
jgi:hypothetical protein